MLSTDTPNTEVRAMLRAQDELYRMLGISLPDNRVQRRPHSVIGSPGHPDIPSRPSVTTMSTNSIPPHTAAAASRLLRADSSDSMLTSYRVSKVDGRPQSYPVSLLDAYNNNNTLDADVGFFYVLLSDFWFLMMFGIIIAKCRIDYVGFIIARRAFGCLIDFLFFIYLCVIYIIQTIHIIITMHLWTCCMIHFLFFVTWVLISWA